MIAKINGTNFNANNPFETNMFSETNRLDYYPLEDFVMLQGRQGGAFGTPQINIWLKKSQIAFETYTFGLERFDTPPSHYIDLIDLTSMDYESTKEGCITIKSVNTTTKKVVGTFQFTTVADTFDSSAPVNYTVNNGTFNYKYDN
ncbi:DUF6252 family protein [Flavobacterium sp.]|uniref:DUF6252 family protein n=2 Tax=Flavobacterium sp. TaxID=239 RepID=UPI002630E297|nr:DUF6252 family protein [Flavobacterium sp.]